MKNILTFTFLVTTLLASQVPAQAAAPITGKIHTIHANIDAPLILVQLEGKPLMGDSPCMGSFTGNLMTDDKFMKSIYPLLLMAKTTREDVVIWIGGCTGNFPRISAIDLTPRL